MYLGVEYALGRGWRFSKNYQNYVKLKGSVSGSGSTTGLHAVDSA